MEDTRPKIGTGIMIVREGKVLLGKRKGSHGEGFYAMPGGHLEHGESFFDCLKRELKEETNMDLKTIKFIRILNEKDHLPKHYINCGFLGESEGEPEVMEPEKCYAWEWFDLNTLPEPLYPATQNLLEAYKSGQNFFDS